MLANFIITFTPVETYPLTEDLSRHIHAFFFEALKQVDEKLANETHDNQGLKPFACSPLTGKYGKTSTQVLLVKGMKYQLKISTLSEPLFKAFSSYIFPASIGAKTVSIGKMQFFIESVDLKSPNIPEWSEPISYSSAYEQSENYLKNGSIDFINLRFYFKTPTSFKKGNVNYPLPEPALIFKSLISKWNAFSDKKIDPLTDRLYITSCRINTKTYSVKNGEATGFVGTCKMRISSKDKKITVPLLALTKFANYSGVGQKTTMGMGVVRANYGE